MTTSSVSGPHVSQALYNGAVVVTLTAVDGGSGVGTGFYQLMVATSHNTLSRSQSQAMPIIPSSTTARMSLVTLKLLGASASPSVDSQPYPRPLSQKEIAPRATT